jgi:hypothetical protein
MKPFRLALVAGMVAAAGCSRQAAVAPVAAGAYDGAATQVYLAAVGKIRADANSENKERIPALIHGEDVMMLGNEAARFRQYKETLVQIPAAKVDPDAVQFAQNFAAIVDCYASVCNDSAELFREAAHEDELKPDSRPLVPEIKESLPDVEVDAISAVNSLVEAMGHLDYAKSGYVSLDPIVARLRDDREKLVAAKEVHHLFTMKIKPDFSQKYPDINWSDRDVLPP